MKDIAKFLIPFFNPILIASRSFSVRGSNSISLFMSAALLLPIDPGSITIELKYLSFFISYLESNMVKIHLYLVTNRKLFSS